MEYKTADGVLITPGLRVFTNDWEWGTVTERQFERGGMSDPGGEYFDGWFEVQLDGRTGYKIYNGERMTTREPR
jgi:hypothetical protein